MENQKLKPIEEEREVKNLEERLKNYLLSFDCEAARDANSSGKEEHCVVSGYVYRKRKDSEEYECIGQANPSPWTNY